MKEYEVAKFEVHSDFTDDYHKNRIAFLILNGEVNVLRESNMSHLEWYKSLGENDDQKFNNLVRGYFYKDYLVAYKGNFEFDDEMIRTFLGFVEEIGKQMKIGDCKVYAGLVQRKGSDGLFPPNKLLGKLAGGRFMPA